jgi:hypothetical protein
MITTLSALVSLLSFRIRSRASLKLELIALRNQVTVRRRQQPARIAPRRVQYTRQALARSLPPRRSEVCITATNVALHELLGRPKWHACFRGRPFSLSNCVARMQRQSELMYGASHSWPIFYSADKQSSLAIFTAEPILKPIFLSKDTPVKFNRLQSNFLQKGTGNFTCQNRNYRRMRFSVHTPAGRSLADLLIFCFAKTIGSVPQPSSLPAPWDAQPRGRHRL